MVSISSDLDKHREQPRYLIDSYVIKSILDIPQEPDEPKASEIINSQAIKLELFPNPASNKVYINSDVTIE